jgi:hypothetical protein
MNNPVKAQGLILTKKATTIRIAVASFHMYKTQYNTN